MTSGDGEAHPAPGPGGASLRTVALLPAALVAAGLAALALAGCSDGSGAGVGSGVGDRFFVDERGRAVIYHGTNVESAAKGAPDRMPTITRDEVRMLAEHYGFNLVRFLIFWDAVEPQPDVYDQAYLDRVEQRLDWHAEAGVDVLLDMHQDVYAARFCCDGAPEWAIRDDGLPFELQPLWSFNYFQPAVTRAFDNFWNYDEGEHPDLQDHYLAAWQAVVARFRDHPAVIGYDVMNEPYPGSAFDHAEAALRRSPYGHGKSAWFDRERFGPFYQRAIDAIRAVDPDGWIAFEPRFGAPANGAPSWIPRLDDPRPGATRLVHSPHLYSALFEFTETLLPGNDTLARWEEERTIDAERQGGGPTLIGEWGFGHHWEGAETVMRETLAMADRMRIGWTHWSFDPGGSWSFYDRATGGDLPHADFLVRPYPRAVAGEPLSWSYDVDTRVFELVFEERGGARGPTELYVPRTRHYPGGFRVEVDGADVTTAALGAGWDPVREVLSIATPAGGSTHRVVVRP